MLDIRENTKCRALDIVTDTTGKDLHFKLVKEFIQRNIYSPRGGSSGPLCEDGIVVKGKYRFVFSLNEEVADEYLRRMNEGK